MATQQTSKRKLRNLLLQPALQVRLGLYCAAVSAAFAALVYGILLVTYRSLSTALDGLMEQSAAVKAVIGAHWSGTQLWIYGSAVLYTVVIIGLSIWFTHKMVGPTIAFRRHIDRLTAGERGVKTNLRKGDAFQEVAEALNRLTDVLSRENTKGTKRE